MDADDRMRPDRLARQAALLDARPDISVAGSLVEIFAEGAVGEGMKVYQAWLNSLVEPGDIAREIFIESPIAHPSAMVRRDELFELGRYRDAGWPEDYDLWLRYHAAGRRFAKVPEVLLYWREHGDRLTRTDPRYSVENFLRVKAHFLVNGPLQDRDGLIVWGAGQTGRRLTRHIVRMGRPIDAFVDISPRKIGNRMREAPVIGPDELSLYLEPLPPSDAHRRRVLAGCTEVDPRGPQGHRPYRSGRLPVRGLNAKRVGGPVGGQVGPAWSARPVRSAQATRF